MTAVGNVHESAYTIIVKEEKIFSTLDERKFVENYIVSLIFPRISFLSFTSNRRYAILYFNIILCMYMVKISNETKVVR